MRKLLRALSWGQVAGVLLTALLIAGAALIAAVAPGVATTALVAAATLLPVLVHARHVGWRGFAGEPSAATIIVLFYVFVFPLRGLVIALSGYADVDLIAGGLTNARALAIELLIASAGTAVLVEAFHRGARSWNTAGRTRPWQSGRSQDPAAPALTLLAAGLLALSMVALVGVLARYGGVGGAKAALLSHSKDASLQGGEGAASSVWSIFAVPAVWVGAGATANRHVDGWIRWTIAAGVLIVLGAQLLVYGSRLNALLALLGAWVVTHHAGRQIPSRVLLGAIPVAILVSVPILGQRPGGIKQNLSTVEIYSRIAGYSVLDSSLAVRQTPDQIRHQLSDPQRWVDLPAYFAPSVLYPGKPNINTRRLDLFVAQNLGNQNQQDTGFPTTYITEWWLLAGVPGVLMASLLAGFALGRLQRRVLGPAPRGAHPPWMRILVHAFVVTTAFTYFKDGDLLTTFVGEARAAVYLSLAALLCGLWRPAWLDEALRSGGRRGARAA